MANIIKIKSGNGSPNPGDLQPCELGWDRIGKTLYIGEIDEQGNPILIKLVTAEIIESSTEE